MLTRTLEDGNPMRSRRDTWCYVVGLINGLGVGIPLGFIVGLVVVNILL